MGKGKRMWVSPAFERFVAEKQKELVEMTGKPHSQKEVTDIIACFTPKIELPKKKRKEGNFLDF